MFTGGASSEAWLVRRRPPAFAARKASTNFSGGSGASAASIPRPMTSGRRQLEQLLDHLEAVGRVVLAVHVGDEAALHPEVDLGGVEALGQPVDDRLHRHAARGVQRGVEEHLPVAQVAEAVAVLHGLVGDPGEVVLVDQRRRHHPEDHQELVDRLVVVELVDLVRGQRDAVLLRLVGEGRGPHRALDVAVQLDLGDGPEELVSQHVRHGREGMFRVPGPATTTRGDDLLTRC